MGITTVETLGGGKKPVQRCDRCFDRVFYGSHNRIVCAQIWMSNTLKFDADMDPNDGFSDARWVLGHELGHVMALGHSAKKALMYPFWPNPKWMSANPASNDVSGLQAIYGQP